MKTGAKFLKKDYLSKMMIKSIEIRTISHATEDEEKVEKALNTLSSRKFKRIVTYGHYGQKIVVMYAKVTGSEANELFEKILKTVGEDILNFVGESEIRLRVDKQEAFKGRILLTELPDYILVSIKFSIKDKDLLVEKIKKTITDMKVQALES